MLCRFAVHEGDIPGSRNSLHEALQFMGWTSITTQQPPRRAYQTEHITHVPVVGLPPLVARETQADLIMLHCTSALSFMRIRQLPVALAWYRAQR